MTAPDLLRLYLDETGQRPADLSRATGIDEGALSRYLRGQRKPGLAHATKIEHGTHGKVPAFSWLAEPKRRTRKTA